MLDAYSVRKAVPRIVLAVIGINLSIYLCVAAVEVTNIVGSGIGDLITAPFLEADTFGALGLENNAANSIAFGGLLISGIIGGAAIWAIGGLALIGMLIPIVITVVLITFAIIFTLVIRQGLIIFLTIVSPVAIALFVLPGTEKYFKKWLDLFIKTLLVYPIVAIIFAMSTVLASILIGTAGDSPDAIGLAKLLATIIVVFAPLVMIPFAFKLAGGSMAAIMNAANGRTANLSGRAGQGFKKWRDDPNSWAGKKIQDRKDDRYEQQKTAGQVFAGVAGGVRNRNIRTPKVDDDGNIIRDANGNIEYEDGRLGFRKAYKKAAGSIHTEEAMKRIEEIGKHQAMQPIKGNDDYLLALKNYETDQDRMNYLMSKEGGGYDMASATMAVASIKRAEAVGSRTEMKRFAAVELAGTGTAYSGGAYEMNQSLIEAADGDAVLTGNMMAQARAKAEGARRGDLVSGFGTNMKALAEQKRLTQEGSLSEGEIAEKINAMVTDNALFTKGAGAILSQRGASVRNMVPAIQRRTDESLEKVQNAYSKKDPKEIQIAEREFMQNLASNAGLLDVASQVSPENAKELADSIMQKKFDLTTLPPSLRDSIATNADGTRAISPSMTMGEVIDRMRTNENFQQMRREYQSSTMSQYQNAQALANAGVQGSIGQPPQVP